MPAIRLAHLIFSDWYNLNGTRQKTLHLAAEPGKSRPREDIEAYLHDWHAVEIRYMSGPRAGKRDVVSLSKFEHVQPWDEKPVEETKRPAPPTR